MTAMTAENTIGLLDGKTMQKYLILAIVLVLASLSCAFPRDKGQFQNIEPKIRAWFKSVKSPDGVPCCDIADGHRATWRGAGNGSYEVRIEGLWLPVPPGAVVRIPNPVGEAVVWHSREGDLDGGELPRIRCFVPGTEG
jgi:hypothetical protein